jgi:CRISPR-associated endoribonuclease Cas6
LWGVVGLRLLVELEALGAYVYDLRYYHKVQGFVYSLLEGTPYGGLHDGRGYKFFCFSNIFPPKEVRRGDVRHFMISSPYEGLLNTFRDRLSKTEKMNVGELSFAVRDVSVLKPKVRPSCTLITATPIIVRIPKENYERYGVKPPRNYAYVYWRKMYPFNAFLKQLEDNLVKKYNDFYGSTLETSPIFEQFVFQKQVCNHVVIEGKEVRVFGSLWKFIFNYLSKEQQRILQFGLDVGFGEMNSLGFGFMNIVR